jgi:hypothetical protein
MKDCRLAVTPHKLGRSRGASGNGGRIPEQFQQTPEALSFRVAQFGLEPDFRRKYRDVLLVQVLEAAMARTRADMGNIQIMDPRLGALVIHVQRGFRAPFLEFFKTVDVGHAACGNALLTGRQIVVKDTADSPVFPDSTTIEVMLDAHVRAVQSTPLIGRSGRILGVLSTHYRRVRVLGPEELQVIDRFARWAAVLAEWHDVGARRTAQPQLALDRSPLGR